MAKDKPYVVEWRHRDARSHWHRLSRHTTEDEAGESASKDPYWKDPGIVFRIRKEQE